MASGQDPIHTSVTHLFGDIASHPQLRQHHQLAHLGQPVAKGRCHTKNYFFPWKNTCNCTTLTVRLTGQHQAVCNTISYTNRAVTICAGGLCPVTIGGHCDLFCYNPLHSQGECGDQEEPHSREGSSNFIPRWTGSLLREVVPGSTQADEEYHAVNFVIMPGALNFKSAKDTEL